MQVQALDSGMLVVRGDQAAVPSRLQMIPMIVAVAAAEPVVGAAVARGTRALSEFGSGIREFARDNGVDP